MKELKEELVEEIKEVRAWSWKLKLSSLWFMISLVITLLFSEKSSWIGLMVIVINFLGSYLIMLHFMERENKK